MSDPSPAVATADPSPCARCGQVHPHGCVAHRSGVEPLTPCDAWPMHGGSVCSAHGGRARQVKAKSKRNVARAKVRARFGGSLVIAPEIALIGQVHAAAWNVEVLRAEVAKLAMVEGGAFGPDHLGDARRHVLVEMYDEERDRLVRMSKLAIDAGLAEREVHVAEQTGQLVGRLVTAALADPEIGLTPEVQELVRRSVGRQLRAIGPGT